MTPNPQLRLLPRGIYLARVRLPHKPVAHYAILDIGNVLARQRTWAPVLYQLSPAGPTYCSADSFPLEVLERIHDEPGATQRFEQALARPDYSILGNNCEHFARFVASGIRTSRQVWGVLVAVTLVAAAVLLWPRNGPT